MTSNDDLLISGLILLALLTMGAFAFHRGTRPHNSLKPRLVPWMVIACGCAASSLMVFVHVVNLLGFETGSGIGGALR